MQKESVQHKSESTAISLQSSQSEQQLLVFSSLISRGCNNFTKQFFKLLKQNESLSLKDLTTKYFDVYNESFDYKKQKTTNPICAKVLTHGDYAFKCYQCQNEDNSIICIQCFNESNHTGHNYQKIEVYGGCCDCGDDQKWKNQGSCIKHNIKQVNVKVDEKQTQRFIKQMQYTLYIVYLLNFRLNKKNHQGPLLSAFVKFLIQFNTQSMVSNQMTFMLMKQKYNENWPKVQYNQKHYALKINTFSFLMRFTKQKQFSRQLVDLFILMFTRYEFKKYLTIMYNSSVHDKPDIIASQFSNISCQIYTSHKIISQLIDEKRFSPIKITQLGQDRKFQAISDIYARFYIDLSYLSNLYNNIGKKYTLYHFQQGNINDLTGYEKYVRQDPQDSIQYYGIQHILIYYRSPIYFRHLNSAPQTVKKCIKDLVFSLQQKSQQQTLNLYISKERTLLILLFILFKGNMQRAVETNFLEEMGINFQLLFKILQAVLNVIRFYAVCLSNRQTVERYYTFYAFCLGKKSRTLVSLDYQLMRFCLLSINNLGTKQIPLLTKEQLSVNLFYEHNNLTFKQNRMPVPSLLALPIQLFLEINKQINQNDQGTYDRKKSLGYLTDYIGLLHQCVTNDYSIVNLKGLYLEKKDENKDVTKFYGDIIKSLGAVKFQDLKEIIRMFIGENPTNLVNFVKQNCVIDNKKLRLNPEVMNKFQSFNLTYLKSLKGCQLIIPYLEQNKKQNPLHKLPSTSFKYQRLIFPQSLVKRLCQAVWAYIQIIRSHPNIIKTDIIMFSNLLQELIKINYSLNSQIIRQLFQNICKEDIFQSLSQTIRPIICQILGKGKNMNSNVQEKKKEGVQTNEEERKKMQMQIKMKKLQKLKSKQSKAIQTLNQQNKKQEMSSVQKIQRIQQQCHQCMYCKMGAESQALSILCFTQKSNMLFKHFMNCQKYQIDFITSCNHMTHESCTNKVYNPNQVYKYCNYCKTSSNLLVKTSWDLEYKEDQQGQTQDKRQNASRGRNVLKSISKQFSLMAKKLSRSLSQPDHSNQVEVQAQLLSPEIKRNQELQRIENQIDKIDSNIETIAYSILYSTLIDYEYFVKFMSRVCYFLTTNIVQTLRLREKYLQKHEQSIEEYSPELLFNKLENFESQIKFTQEQLVFWNSYKFIIISLLSLLGIENQKKAEQNSKWNIRSVQQQLPSEFCQKIIFVLTSIKSTKTLGELEKRKLQRMTSVPVRELPKKLSQLSMSMGACNNCNRITNEIALCLLCQFKSCVACESTNLTKHAQQMHCGASVFIRVDQGIPIYVGLNNNWFFSGIYHNFMGEKFTLFKNQLDRSEFELSISQYDKIKTDILRHRIQQEIRYIEFKSGKRSIVVP